jgi:alpha-glucosidase (family GH31 glycosyl hydrolase)
VRWASALSGLAIAAALAPAARAGPVEELTAGHAISVVVEADPWRLRLVDGHGRELLAEAGAAPGIAGPLGFRNAVGWAHATRATELRREGDRIRATVATSDPLGGELEVTVSRAGRGVIALTAAVRGSAGIEGSGIGFGSAPTERFFGFGERSNAVEMHGQEVENYVSDGAVRPEDRAYPKPFLPPWAVRDRDDATYYPVPWLLSSRGHGVLIDNPQTSWFRLASEATDRWSLEVASDRLELRFFAGRRPAGALRRFTAATGRQPRAGARWFYGPWFQTGQPNRVPLESEREWTEILRSADAPVSAAETQMHYLPCGAHRGAEEYLRQRNEFFHSQGLAHLAYLNPLLCASYEPVWSEAAGAGLLQTAPGGAPYVQNGFVGGSGPGGFTVEPLSQFDFTAAGTEDFYAELVGELIADGHDGWMEDFGEWTPPDSGSADGTPGTAMHNLYPTTFHCALQRIAERQPRPVVRFQRSGWTGSAACAENVWGGDNTTVWGFDGLASAVKEGLSIGLSGVSRWGSDIGGYNSYGPAERLDAELLARWIEFGAVSAIMRTKGGGLAFPSYDRPQIWDPEILPIWRRYAKLHTQLNPYLRAADREHRRTGLPIMRHLALVAPGEPEALEREDQFMFGPALLAAPVIEPGQRARPVYLPKGRWIDFWPSIHYRERDGALIPRRAPVLRGRRTVEVVAPLSRLPLFVRAGAVLPMLPPEIDTLAPYGDATRGIVTLRDRRRQLRLLAFPRGVYKAGLGDRGMLRSHEGARGWELRLSGARGHRFRLAASLSALRRPLRPCVVLLDGEPLRDRAWSYRAEVLRARFRSEGGSSRLVVRACGRR